MKLSELLRKGEWELAKTQQKVNELTQNLQTQENLEIQIQMLQENMNMMRQEKMVWLEPPVDDSTFFMNRRIEDTNGVLNKAFERISDLEHDL